MGLRRAPNLAQLGAIEGVRQIEELADKRYRVHYHPENDPAQRLAELAVGQGWGLYELAPERRTLEDVFVDLTATEPGAEADAA